MEKASHIIMKFSVVLVVLFIIGLIATAMRLIVHLFSNGGASIMWESIKELWRM